MSMQKHGFTLLEVMIAAIIMVGLAMALFAYSSTTTKSWGQMQIKKNQLEELLVVDRAFKAIIPHAVPFNWPDESQEITTDVPFVIARRDMLRCAHLHRLNDQEEGALRFCEIYLHDNALKIKYSDRPFISWDDAGERTWTSTLAENVQNLDFKYADWDSMLVSDNWEERLRWVDEWDNVDVERYDLPLAVKIRLEFKDGRTYTWLSRTMGNGYRERFGKWEAQDETAL